MKLKRYSAIHVGESGFPFGTATVNKCMAIYEALYHEGIDVLIINYKGYHGKNVPIKIEKDGYYNDLHYIYTSPSQYYVRSKIKRKMSSIIGRINEFRLIFKKLCRKEIDLIIYSPNKPIFINLLYYRLISKIFNRPLIAHYVEYASIWPVKNPIIRLDYALFDKYLNKYVDGVLPISDFLISKLGERGKPKPYLKIPPICDYDFFDKTVATDENGKYFLYAADIGYQWALDLVIESYLNLHNTEYKLNIIVYGETYKINQLKSTLIERKLDDKIIVHNKLRYDDLVKMYKGAKGLLIPLSGSIRDTARFPHKISEYLASANPVITINNGEISKYLKDGENALVCSSERVEEFSEKMKFVIENPEKAVEIGKAGYQLGLMNFNIIAYRKPLKDFVMQFIEKRK